MPTRLQSTALIGASACLLLSLSGGAHQATDTGAITGTVVDAGGRPVASAIVTLEERRPGTPTRSYVQVTTPTGRFAFVDLPASDAYFLSSSKPGFLKGGYGTVDPHAPGAPMVLRESGWLRDVRIAMARPGSIGGTVVDERGEPVVGAFVRVLPQVFVSGRLQWLAGPAARTDDRGVYRIPGLGPGLYVVSIPAVQATLPASATIKTPGAGAGTSMADLRASSSAAGAEKLLVDVGGGQQIVVGRYAVPPPATDGQRTAYGIAFYPNASTPATAAPVELRVSEDKSGIDFQLQPVRTARVSGVLQGPPDAVGNLLLRLIPIGLEELGQGSEAATTVTLSDGRFSFFDVPNGTYALQSRHSILELTHSAVAEPATAVPAPVPFPASSASGQSVMGAPWGVELSALDDRPEANYWGELRVDVSGRNVDDVTLALKRAATMSGRMVWAPGATPTAMAVPMLEPADGRRTLGMPSAPFFSTQNRQGAGSAPIPFSIDGLMGGEYLLRVRNRVNIESIVWNGEDYTDRPFDAREGKDFTDVLVTLTSASSSVAGTVSDGAVPTTSPSAVIAFPAEPERRSKYGFTPTRLASVLTTADGRYRLDGLPRGDYYLMAVPAAQDRAWVDPAFLAARVGRATRVQIDPSGAKITDLSLTLIK